VVSRAHFWAGNIRAGESQTPNISLAGGFGGGMGVQAHLAHSHCVPPATTSPRHFSLTGNSPALGYSPHKHWNSRAGSARYIDSEIDPHQEFLDGKGRPPRRTPLSVEQETLATQSAISARKNVEAMS